MIPDGRIMALKRLHLSSPDGFNCISEEFTMLSGLELDGLVRAYWFGRDDSGAPAYLMDWVDGSNPVHYFNSDAARQDGLPRWLLSLASVLRQLHRLGLVHLDIKPGNLLVRADGTAVLLDFGLARAIGATRGGGSLGYSAPEILDGEPFDGRADLYSVGVVLHEILTGARPERPRDRVQGVAPSLPPGPLGLLASRLLAPAAAERLPAASELVAALERLLGYPRVPRRAIAPTEIGLGPSKWVEPVVAELAAARRTPLLLVGAEGSGRSTILRQLRARLMTDGYTVELACAGDASGAPLAFARLLLARIAEPGSGTVGPAPNDADGFAAALAAALIARSRPALLVDDAHLLDAESRATLWILAGRHAGLKLVLAGTQAMAAAVARPDSIAVPSLDARAIADFVAGMVGARRVADDLADRLARVSGGRPGPLAILVRALASSGRLVRTAEDLLVCSGELGDVALLQLASSRRDPATGFEGECLALLAAADRPLAAAEIAGLCKKQVHAVTRFVTAEVAAGRLTTILGPPTRFAFPTPADRLAVYSALKPAARRAAHRVLLGAATIAAERVLHAARAGLAAEALAALPAALAAAQAAQHRAHEADILAEVVAVATTQPAATRRDLLAAAARAALTADQPARALRFYGRLERLARRYGKPAVPPALHLEIQRGMARAHELAGDHGAALAALAAAHDSLIAAPEPTAAPDETLADLEVAMGWMHARRSRYAEASELANAALARPLVSRSAVRAEAHNLLGVIAWFQSDWDRAIGEHFRALRIRRRRGEKRDLARSYNNLGLAYRAAGRLARALRCYDTSLRLKEEVGDLGGAAVGRYNLAYVLWDQGRGEEARALAEAALEWAETRGATFLACECLGLLGEIRGQAGEYEIAERLLIENRRLAVHAGSDNEATVADRRLGELRLAVKDAGGARELLNQALRSARSLSSPFEVGLVHRALARCHLLAGKPAAARASLRRSREALVAAKNQLELTRTEFLRIEVEHVEGSAEWRDGLKRCLARAERLGALGTARAIRDRLAAASPLRHSGPELQSEVKLRLLYELSRSITSLLDPEELLPRILDIAIEAVGAERGFILLADDDSGKLVAPAARHLSRETIADPAAISSSAVRTVFATGRSLLAADVSRDAALRAQRSVLEFDIRSILCVPLRLGDRILGTLYVDSTGATHPFREEDRAFLEAFAGQAAVAITNARQMDRMRKEREDLKRENLVLRERATRQWGGEIIAESAAMRSVIDLVDRVAGSDVPVLLLGESGTGKEVIARALHAHSPRNVAPFLAVNCAAIPGELLESELFGHERGAFTGAVARRLGSFELSGDGVLLLDEIGELSPALQAKLLRAIEERRFNRVGGSTAVTFRARLIAATNRDLEQAVVDGSFRADLYFRLAVVPIHLPPLRERREDIAPLLIHFLARVSHAIDRRPVPTLHPRALELLVTHGWPGNVRELENLVHRLLLTVRGNEIGVDDLPASIRTGQAAVAAGDPLATGIKRILAEVSYSEDEPLLDRVEIELVRQMVARAGEKQRAARLLGISKPTLFKKLKLANAGEGSAVQ
jgi:Nif-specific regulatory protein